MFFFYKNYVMKNLYMPMPSNISYFWNFGFLLGFCLVLQLISGIFLTMYYISDSLLSFDSVNNFTRNVFNGWLIRSLHANGASLFFLLIYLHVGRGLYYKSYSLKYTWISGCFMLLFLFMIAFIGYVLPWGQMSFWGATVITNLLTAIPYVGESITIWIWGGFSVDKATLMRFYTFHFLFPFILVFLVLIHIIFLHETGSSNPLNINSNLDKICFSPYFLFKDLYSLMILLLIFFIFVFCLPYNLMDPDNFIPANSLITPPHIQPEWYFLFAYAILRCVPSKLGGVVALLMSILILFLLPFTKIVNKKGFSFNPFFKYFYFIWVFNFISLIIMGAMPVEDPFISFTSYLSVIYFIYFFLMYLILSVLAH